MFLDYLLSYLDCLCGGTLGRRPSGPRAFASSVSRKLIEKPREGNPSEHQLNCISNILQATKCQMEQESYASRVYALWRIDDSNFCAWTDNVSSAQA